MVLVYPGVLLFWLVIHPNIQYWRKRGKRAYWVACGVWPVTWFILGYFRAVVFFSRLAVSPILIGAGVIAFAAALYVGVMAGKTISLRTMVGLPELEPQRSKQRLLEGGIYGRTRNPIYLAHWLLVFSAAAITGLAANWVLFAADCLVLPVVIRVEERELMSRFGPEFMTYMSEVPRFFPRL
jgi:protein-S-isoprenylcysteine O-methyltransferase Ste14